VHPGRYRSAVSSRPPSACGRLGLTASLWGSPSCRGRGTGAAPFTSGPDACMVSAPTSAGRSMTVERWGRRPSCSDRRPGEPLRANTTSATRTAVPRMTVRAATSGCHPSARWSNRVGARGGGARLAAREPVRHLCPAAICSMVRPETTDSGWERTGLRRASALVVERVILGRHRELAVPGIGRGAPGQGPRLQDTPGLDTHVVVQARRIVLLDREARLTIVPSGASPAIVLAARTCAQSCAAAGNGSASPWKPSRDRYPTFALENGGRDLVVSSLGGGASECRYPLRTRATSPARSRLAGGRTIPVTSMNALATVGSCPAARRSRRR
jgi:hypothetical protein